MSELDHNGGSTLEIWLEAKAFRAALNLLFSHVQAPNFNFRSTQPRQMPFPSESVALTTVRVPAHSERVLAFCVKRCR